MTNRKRLAQACGVVALIGCVIVAGADLLGVTLAHNIGPVAETISNVAAGGRYDWLEDAGLYSFVVAVLAVAGGISLWKVAGWDWAIGRILLAVLAGAVVAIAAYEAYNRPGGGPDLHLYFVGLLAVCFPLAVWLTSRGLTADPRAKWALRLFAAIWAVAAPPLYLMPTGWDGLYERALALLMLGWFALAAFSLWRRSDRARIGANWSG